MRVDGDLSAVTETVVSYGELGIELGVHTADGYQGPLEDESGRPLRYGYIDQVLDLAIESGLPDPLYYMSDEHKSELRAKCEASRKRERGADLPLFALLEDK